MSGPPSAPPPAQPPVPGRSTWYVGILAVIILAYILINGLRTQGPGASGPRTGAELSPFAVPLAASALEGDANVATEGSLGDAGKVPACSVRGPDVLNSCALAERGPVVLGFLATRGADCTGSFDALQRLSQARPEVGVAGVIVRGDRDDARALVGQRGWTFPVGFDRDGIVSSLYGIAVCPEVVLAYPGGRIRETLTGQDRAVRELDRRVAALVAESRRRGWRPAG